MTDSQMLYTVEDHVATITFNRPEQQNTISGSMLNRFSKLLLEADSDADVRAIVITGTGKFFCAGLDLRGSDITDNLSTERSTPTTLDLKNTPPTVLHNLDTPTIAALNGSAAGYGMDLALGCDIRIMADHAKLAAAFTARGVSQSPAALGFCYDLSAGRAPAKLSLPAKPSVLPNAKKWAWCRMLLTITRWVNGPKRWLKRFRAERRWLFKPPSA